MLSSIEKEFQEKYYSELTKITDTKKLLPSPLNFHKHDKAKIIALSRFDLVNLWQEQRKQQEQKSKFDIDFLNAYNSKVS